MIYLNGFLEIRWLDSALLWKPEDYGNITVIQIDITELWVPGIDTSKKSFLKF